MYTYNEYTYNVSILMNVSYTMASVFNTMAVWISEKFNKILDKQQKASEKSGFKNT